MRAGGSVVVDGNKIDSRSLPSIAGAGKDTGATLIIKHANKIDKLSASTISKANPGHVIFDFSE